MAGPLLLAGIGAGANILGGALGEWWAQADEKERERLERLAVDQFGNLSVPALERVLAQEVERSAMEGQPADFGQKGARNAAIQRLMEEGLSGGNTLESQLAQAQAQRTAGQAARQGSQAALQSAQSRGMGGAASTLQAQLLGASTGADRAAQVGLEGAANARRQALQALSQGGSMAGQAERDDTDADTARRSAVDRIAMFNAGQRSSADQFNQGLRYQQFNADLAARQARANAYGQAARSAGDRANRKRGVAGGIGQGVGYGLGAAALYGKG